MPTNYLFEIAGAEVQSYIFSHEDEDVQALVLHQKQLCGVPSSIIAGQLSARKKARHKIPTWYHKKGIIYPPSVNLEQASSEATALFKKHIIASNIFSHSGKAGADLTGGFGIDSFFISSCFNSFHYIEPNHALAEIVKHNHYQLGCTTINYHHTTAENFIHTEHLQLDFIYLDPSRRDELKKKVVRLSDCSPDIAQLQESLLKVSKYVLVKASPLLDIQQAMRELKHVKNIYVVAVENECKELLFLMQKDFAEECVVEAVDLKNDGSVITSFKFRVREELSLKVSCSEPQEFIYEPNAAILKAGAFKLIALKYQLKKLSANTHLYTSSLLIGDFPGRSFKIENLYLNEKTIDELLPEKKANITTRNYPLTPSEIKKKYRLHDGGEKFLIGFSSDTKKYLVLASRITKT
jgi:16S rRNA G966 N2-methylase RsmD